MLLGPGDGHLSFLVKKNFKGTIKQGTPLVQLFPVRREEWQSELASHTETKSIFRRQRAMLRSVFTGGYKSKFRSKKDYK